MGTIWSKWSIGCGILALLLFAPAGEAQLRERNDLRKKTERRFLAAADRICADTWCAGDHDFRFRALDCDFIVSVCVLRYDAAEWSDPGQRRRYDRSEECVIRGIHSGGELFESRFGEQRLSSAVYGRISECIAEQFLPPSP